MDVEKEAQRLEQDAKVGLIEDMSRELHEMSPADRLAVARQIQSDQKAHPDPSLPKMEFYDSGDLKSSDSNMAGDTTVHTSYDRNSGRRLTEDYKSSDGSSSHWIYNPETGQSKSGEYHYADGTSSHNEFDPKTRKIWSVETDSQGRVSETKGTDGKSRKFHYDENGKLDGFDGRLGHWERRDGADGKEVWCNKDTGAEWKGSFKVDASGTVVFKSQDGGVWSFGRDGGEKKVAEVDLVSKGEHGETIHKNENDQITKVEDQRGTTYKFKYDGHGELAAARIVGRDGEAAESRKVGGGDWQSYGNDGKPSYLRLKGGDWSVDANGVMRHTGEIVPLPQAS
jgi:YD repeat-containing protein